MRARDGESGREKLRAKGCANLESVPDCVWEWLVQRIDGRELGRAVTCVKGMPNRTMANRQARKCEAKTSSDILRHEAGTVSESTVFLGE